MNKDVATQAENLEGEDLGIGKPMQIRSVPAVVREWWNHQAYINGRVTLGEHFTRVSLRLMREGDPASVVDTAVASPSVPVLPRLDLNEMSSVIQAITAAASAGVPVQKRVVRGVFSLLDGQLRAANGLPALAPRKPSIRQITMGGLPENRPSLPMGKPQ